MTFNYTALANVAIDQIADKGRSVTLKHVNSGVYDPQNDTNGSDASTTQTVKMLFTKFKSSEVDDTLIKRSDVLGLLATDSLTASPKTNDKIVDDNIIYTIIDVDTIKPGDGIILYKLQLRK